MNYLYHKVPENMMGHILYPLNQLQYYSPELYQKNISKYRGRESFFERKIPPLSCLWNDVIFFLPIHPIKFKEVFEKNGHFDRYKGDFFKIPVSKLDPEFTAIYMNGDFYPYTPEAVSDYTEIPEDALCDLSQKLLDSNQKVLPYNKSPHVIYKGVLDITGLEIISI